MSVNTSAEALSRDQSRTFARRFCIVAILVLAAAPLCAESITTPYLGITRITDSIALSAPADQTPGSGLGAHNANINVIQIDLNAPGIGFKLSPGNGDTPGESLTQTTLQYLAQENAQLAVNVHFFNFTSNAPVNLVGIDFSSRAVCVP